MGFFGSIKKATKKVAKKASGAAVTVATGGLNKVAKSSAVPKPINAVLNPVTQAKGVVRAQKAAGHKLSAGLRTMHLTSVSEQLNVARLVTNPKKYFTKMGEGYVKDIEFGSQFYATAKKGGFKAIAQQGAAETVKAVGGSKKLQKKAAEKFGKLGAIAEKVKKPSQPEAVTPEATTDANAAQLTGDMYIPTEPYPAIYDMPPSDEPGGLSPVLLIGGALAALVLVLVVVR